MEDQEKTKDESKSSVTGTNRTIDGLRDSIPEMSASRRDLLIIGVLSLALFAAAAAFDLCERFADWSRAHERWEIDELVVLSVILVVAAAIFAFRRWMEYRHELVRGNQAREALRKAHDALDLRVRQRTSELSSTNEQLEREIVERKKAEKLLRESESRYRQLFENSLTAIVTVDAQGIIQSWNSTCERISVYSADEAIGANSATFFLKHDQVKSASEILSRVFQGESITGIEWDLGCKDGSIRKMISLVYPLMNDQGTVVECAIASTDVSDLRSVENELRESQQRLELALRGADLGLWDYHLDTGRLNVDQRWAEMHGYSVDELEPDISTWGRLVHPEDRSQILEAFNAHAEGRTPMYESVNRHRSKSGEWIWVQSRGRVVERDENGTATCIAGTTLDVTERKEAEEALKQSEERYRFVVENARETISVVQDRKIRFANRSAIEQSKYSEEQMLSMCSLDLLVPEDREIADENYARRLQGEPVPNRYTLRFLDAEGGVYYQEIKPVPVMWEGAPAVLIFGTDVTDRQRAEKALIESEQRLQLALEGADLGLWDWNMETGEAFFNRRSVEMLGYSLEEIDHHISDWGRLVHPEDVPGITEAFNAHLEGRAPFYESEHRLRRKSGEWMWNLARAKVVERKPDGTPVRVTGINRDITEQKLSEKALRESEQFNRRLVENAPMGIIYLDADGVIEYANPASNRIFGVPEDQPTPLLGYNAFDLPLVAEQPHVRAYFDALMQGDPQSDIEISYRSPLTGQDYTLLAQGTPRRAPEGSVIGAVIMYLDLTERKKAQDELKASVEEKELLLREMHHRVKNNLQVMSSLLSLQAGYVKDEQHAQMFHDAESRIRAMGLVHGMMYQSENLKAINCNEYVHQMVGHLFRYYGTPPERVTCKTTIEDIVIELDTAVSFGLMLRELISNSLQHAFPNGRTGEIEISMRLVNGQAVELVTRDNGIGMPPEIDLDHALTLGLRLVKVLAAQLGASVELDRDRGTEFRIRFNGCP